MKLSQYPRPKDDTGLGIHGGANAFYPIGERSSDYPYWINELRQMGFKWYKLAVAGDAGGEAIQALLAAGIMPVVRMYRPEPNPGTLVDNDPKGKEWLKRYADLGTRYFEVNNEPNLLGEWKDGWGANDADPTEWKKGNQPQRVAQSWVKDAEFVIANGGLPGLPALSPGGNYNDVDFLRLFLTWLKEHKYQDLLAQGCWIAIHNGTLNHPLDYPADEVNQKGTPVSQAEYAKYQWAGDINFVNGERAKGKNPGQHLLSVDNNGRDTGGSNCWLKFQAYRDLFVQIFGFEIPILGTEGGVWSDTLADPRYPKVSVEMQRDWTLEICRKMMSGGYPDYYFCTGFWLMANKGMGSPTSNGFENDAWYSPWRAETGGRLPVVDALKALPKQARKAPADTLPAPASPGASRIFGTVVDQKKQPVPGAAVSLRSNAIETRSVVVPTSGTYEFKDLPAATYLVTASDFTTTVKADGKASYPTDLTVSAKDAYRYVLNNRRVVSRDEGPCSCPKGCGIYGTVTDNQGHPLPDVRIRIGWDGGSAEVTTGNATSKTPGRYEYSCTPGVHTISVVKGDWPSETLSDLRTDWVPDHCYGKVVHEVNFQLKAMVANPPRLGLSPLPPVPLAEALPPAPPPPPKLAHYMLFARPQSARARQELRAAVEYVVKSGVTVGFNLEEAAGAKIITIVGGADVVSDEAEQSLRNLGHEVNRIGGDRGDILDALEDLGSRRLLRGGRAAGAAEGGRPARATGKAGVIQSAKGAEASTADAATPARKTRGKKRT